MPPCIPLSEHHEVYDMNISTLWLRYWQIAYRNDLRPLNPTSAFLGFLDEN